MTKVLQGLFGGSPPGTRACGGGCFDPPARAVCATRLVTVDAVSGFAEVSTTPAKPTRVKGRAPLLTLDDRASAAGRLKKFLHAK